MDNRIFGAIVFLVQAAKDRRLVTYGEVGAAIGVHGVQVGSHVMREVADVCSDYNAPFLGVLVINEKEYMPGRGFWRAFLGDEESEERLDTWCKMLRETCEYDWDSFLEDLAN